MYLWVEGVQFDRTIYDTDDISTIRGSSMYLEELADRLMAALSPLGGVLHDFGASRAVVRFGSVDATRLREALARFMSGDPYQHFCLIQGTGDTMEEARRNARLAQLRGWSIPLSGPETAAGPDPLDRVRPATVEDRSPGTSVIRYLSPSVAVRLKNGRRHRPNAFAAPMVPPPSFEDIVDVPATMPEVVRGKLAVVVADGVGIGALAGTYPEGPAFAHAAAEFRNRISRAVVDWVQSPENGPVLVGSRTKAGQEKLFPRLDVLVWGGDDMTFVLPASHLLDFLSMLMAEFQRPFAPGRGPLPHRIGCIVAQHKAPIRQMRALASDAEGRLKRVQAKAHLRDRSMFSIDIFESAALPHATLGPYRTALYGPGDHDAEHAFAMSDLPRVRDFLASVIGEGHGCIAVSKLHDALRRAGTNALIKSTGAIMAELNDHFAARGEPNPAEGWIRDYAVPDKSLPILFAQMAQLHPYSQVRS